MGQSDWINALKLTMNMTTAPLDRASCTDLAPNFTIPLVLVAGAVPLLWLNLWLSLAIAVFGVFLTFQTVLIKLRFTDSTLEVYRSGKLIRSFPYADWQNWRIFWEPVPILFYFKEVKSIHFLPIIFDARALKDCLEYHCPLQNLRPE